MKSIHKLEDILNTFGKDDYFVDFLNTMSLEAGIIRLREGQEDIQTTHSLDEIYYVIGGEGYIRIEGKSQPVNQGTIVFVPAEIDHNFYGNKEDLVVLYIFSKHKMAATSKG
jgi:mannose-6-phosphate isomerase-like protein (cupin superfamily)